MVLLARTTPIEEVEDRLDGLSVYLIEMRNDDGSLIDGLTINPIETMMNHSTTEVFFDGVLKSRPTRWSVPRGRVSDTFSTG